MVLLVPAFYIFIPVIAGIYAIWMARIEHPSFVAAGSVLLRAVFASAAFYFVMQAVRELLMPAEPR